MTTGPLDDQELGWLYEYCKQRSSVAYALVRRLHSFGVIPDPPTILDDDWESHAVQPTTKPGSKHRGHVVDGIWRCWDCPATRDMTASETEVK